MNTTKVSAQQFIEDVRSGSSRDDLMERYGLTPERFNLLLEKLLERNWLTQADVDRFTESKPEPPPVGESPPPQKGITRLGHLFLLLWVIGLAALFAGVGYGVTSFAHKSKLRAIERHKSLFRVKPIYRSRKTAVKAPRPAQDVDKPEEVKIGVDVDRIVSMSLRDGAWTVDFRLWLTWRSDKLDPGKTFQVVNGRIDRKIELLKKKTDQGYYALYQVIATIHKDFDRSTFPCDEHLLTIRIQDTISSSNRLRYIADVRRHLVASQTTVPGYKTDRTTAVVKPHTYMARGNDPKASADIRASYSQFVYGIWISRPDVGHYVKTFQGTFAAVLIALLALCVRPVHLYPRFGLGMGAFLAALAAMYITSSPLSNTGVMTMVNMVNGLGALTIALTLVQSTISLNIYGDGENPQLSRAFDRRSFVVLLVGYTFVNAAIPFSTLIWSAL